jgi:hypothetical protein
MKTEQPPLIKVREASKEILKCSPQSTYEAIKKKVYPAGVVVFLSEKRIRFNRDRLIAWLESGGNYRAA